MAQTGAESAAYPRCSDGLGVAWSGREGVLTPSIESSLSRFKMSAPAPAANRDVLEPEEPEEPELEEPEPEPEEPEPEEPEPPCRVTSLDPDPELEPGGGRGLGGLLVPPPPVIWCLMRSSLSTSMVAATDAFPPSTSWRLALPTRTRVASARCYRNNCGGEARHPLPESAPDRLEHGWIDTPHEVPSMQHHELALGDARERGCTFGRGPCRPPGWRQVTPSASSMSLESLQVLCEYCKT